LFDKAHGSDRRKTKRLGEPVYKYTWSRIGILRAETRSEFVRPEQERLRRRAATIVLFEEGEKVSLRKKKRNSSQQGRCKGGKRI